MDIRRALAVAIVLLAAGVGGALLLEWGTASTSATNHNVSQNATARVQAPSSCARILATPPSAVGNEDLVDIDHAFVFHERSTHLSRPIQLDVTAPGTVDSPSDLTQGTVDDVDVHSYLIHYDTGTESFPRRFINCTISFDDDIIGVILRDGSLTASDGELGAQATTYHSISSRGLEFSQDQISADFQTNTVRIEWGVVSPFDQIRVLTQANLTTSNETEMNETQEVPPPNATVLTEDVVTKDISLSVAVSNLTVLTTPPQWTYLKESSCLVQESDAWSAGRQAELTVSTGNRTLVTCVGASPTAASESPKQHLPPGTEIRISTNDGARVEVDLWLQILANESVTDG